MKQDNINYLMVGSLVLGALVLLLIVLIRLTGQQGATDSYYVIYKNITGIQSGSEVTYGGFHIGQVEQIRPVDNHGATRFKLTLAVREGWRIPQNSIARIVSPGVLSDPQIDIHEGDSSERLHPGGMMQGREAVNLFAAMDTVADEFTDLSQHNLKPLLSKLSQRIDSISEHLERIGGNLSGGIPGVLTKANTLLDSLNHSAGEMDNLLSSQNQQHINSLFSNADIMSQKLVGLSNGFDKVVNQLDQMLTHSNHLLANSGKDVRDAVVSLRNSLHSVSQNIDEVIYNIKAGSQNFNEFSHEIRLNPGELLRSSPAPDQADGQ